MTITIRDITTGESIRSWNHPGGRQSTKQKAYQYAVGKHAKVIQTKTGYDVYIIPKD